MEGLNGVSMTRDGSLISVTFNGQLLIIDFPFDHKIKNLVRQVEGVKWNELVEKKWAAPRTSYNSLKETLGDKAVWKTSEEVKQAAAQLKFKEETLDDVLSRVPKNIKTPYMKIEPYDFQKLMVAWGITRKGKKANIYGGLLGDLMG